MKKFFILFLASLVLLPLTAGVAPVSQKMGKVAVEVEKESPEELVLKAVGEEFSEEWVENYAIGGELFLAAYTNVLSSSLPLTNPILTPFNDHDISVMSLESGIRLVFLLKEGRIAALLED